MTRKTFQFSQKNLKERARWGAVLLSLTLLTPSFGVRNVPGPRRALPPTLAGERAAYYPRQHGLRGSLAEAMTAARYGIYWSEHTPIRQWSGAYYAENPAQQFRAFFNPDGMAVETNRDGRSWRLGMRLSGCGYGERLFAPPPGDLLVSGNRVEIRHQLAPAEAKDRTVRSGPATEIVEWYINQAEGVEQGFRIAESPGERNRGETLKLKLEVEGSLRPRMTDEGRAIDLIGIDGEPALRYDRLAVRDAGGKQLEARMRVVDEQVWLEVNDAGAAYPITIDPTFSQQQKLTGSDPAAGDNFGLAVAISGDTAVVGAYLDEVGSHAAQGSAYVFVRSGTTWTEQQKLTASDGNANDEFGVAVAISGDTIVVGAWRATVGSNFAQGAAYAFLRSGTVWSEQQKLTASDGGFLNQLGNYLGISGDTIVVGALNAFTAGAQGAAYVFVRSGTTWSQQQKLTSSDGQDLDQFGSVAISGDTIVVGARGNPVVVRPQGAAYVFVRSGTVWTQQQKLFASDGAQDDNFGVVTGIDGDTVVVGAWHRDANRGAAYVYVRSGTTWTEQQKLLASDGMAGDLFGEWTAISGDTIVVGAPAAAVGPNPGQGAGYVFDRSGTTWTQEQKLSASDGAPGDSFGVSVAISGTTIVVGAFQANVGPNMHQGSAYVFASGCAPVMDIRSLQVWYGSALNGSTVVTNALELTDHITGTVGNAILNANVDPRITANNLGLWVDNGAGDMQWVLGSPENRPAEQNLRATLAANLNSPVFDAPINHGNQDYVITTRDLSGGDCQFHHIGIARVTYFELNAHGTPTFDFCIKDDATGNLLQFSSTTGAYQFTRCKDGFTLTGTGSVRLANHIETLTDRKPDRRISAGFLTNQLTGHAVITIVAGPGLSQTYNLNQTNPRAVCACNGT
jgi:hypothetical protein